MSKTKLKAVSSTALALGLTFTLFGCSSSSSSNASNNNSTNKVVKLTLETHYSADQETQLKKYIDEWNKENPNIQVVHKSIADFNQLLPTIMAQQTSGQTADIIQVYSLWGGQLAKSHVLATPPSDVQSDIKANFATAAIKGSTVDGQLQGYPTEVETYALFYNKKLLADAGFNQPPKTWDDLYNMSKAITKRDSSNKVSVEGFGLTSGWDSAVVHPYLSFLYSAGGSFLNSAATKANLNTDAGLKALQFEQKFIDNGVTDPSINVLTGFPSEKVAMTINAGWWNGSLKAAMKDKYSDVAVAPIPSPDGTTNGAVSYSFFYGVDTHSQHQAEAWKFLKWLNSAKEKNGATPEGNFLISQGIIPSRNSDVTALNDQLSNPNNQPFIDALKYATPEPNILAGQKIKTDLQKQIESVWSKQTMPQDAIKNATDQINSDLQQ